jgi:hypothetical protein
MHVHRFNGPLGAAIVVGIAVAAAIVMVKRHTPSYPLGVKGDRLEVVVPQSGCSPTVWPYGCEWIEPAPERKHVRPGSNRQHRHGLRRLLS